MRRHGRHEVRGGAEIERARPFERLLGEARRGAGLRTRRGKWAEKGGGAPRDKRGVHTRFTLFFFGALSSLRLGLTSTLPLSFSLGCGQRFSSSFGWSFLFSWALLPSTTREGEPGAGTISPRSRDCADGTERLSFSSTPPERAGLRHVQARRTSPVTTPEGLEERSQGGTTRSREVATSFSFHWVLCK